MVGKEREFAADQVVDGGRSDGDDEMKEGPEDGGPRSSVVRLDVLLPVHLLLDVSNLAITRCRKDQSCRQQEQESQSPPRELGRNCIMRHCQLT